MICEKHLTPLALICGEPTCGACFGEALETEPLGPEARPLPKMKGGPKPKCAPLAPAAIAELHAHFTEHA